MSGYGVWVDLYYVGGLCSGEGLSMFFCIFRGLLELSSLDLCVCLVLKC